VEHYNYSSFISSSRGSKRFVEVITDRSKQKARNGCNHAKISDYVNIILKDIFKMHEDQSKIIVEAHKLIFWYNLCKKNNNFNLNTLKSLVWRCGVFLGVK
jgi:hypothetical protein